MPGSQGLAVRPEEAAHKLLEGQPEQGLGLQPQDHLSKAAMVAAQMALAAAVVVATLAAVVVAGPILAAAVAVAVLVILAD